MALLLWRDPMTEDIKLYRIRGTTEIGREIATDEHTTTADV